MAGDVDYSKTVLLIDCTGFANNATTLTGIDKAYTTAKTLTCNGNAKISTALGYPALAFDGTGDFLSFADTTDLDFSTGAGTIEAEVYLAGNSNADAGGSRLATIISNFNSADTNYWAFYINGNAATTGTGLLFQSNVAIKGVTATVSQSSLHHLAISWDSTGVYFAIDGVVTSTTAFASNIIGGTQPRIGKLDVAGYLRELNGAVKYLRAYKGVAKYKADFTPPASYPAYSGQIDYALTESLAATSFRLVANRISDGSFMQTTIITANGTWDMRDNYPCTITCTPIQGVKWQSGYVFAAGDLVFPTDPVATPYYYKRVAGTGGSSGSTEPAWVATIGDSTTDDGAWNNCWECIALLVDPIAHSPVVPSAATPPSVVFNFTATSGGGSTDSYLHRAWSPDNNAFVFWTDTVINLSPTATIPASVVANLTNKCVMYQ